MILLISGLILYLLKSLDLLYFFQIKEYRLDRILSFLKEENVFKILYLRAIRMPAISLRNLLIGQAMLFSTVPLYLILKTSNLALLSAFLLLTPIVALLTMLLGLLLSEIPVQIYRKLIIFIAALKVKNSNAVFIGITGSYGKTSTKEFLFQILSHKYKVGKTEKNYNSEIGVALSILKNLKSDTEYFIAELGAYKKVEIKTICGIIHPKYGILTAIGNQHLNLFGSKKNLIEAKSELLEVLPPDGVAFINKNIREWKYFSNKTKAEKEYFSIDEIPPDIKTNLPGRHNLQNLLPCIALASHLGLDRSVILETIMNLKPIQDRLTQKKGPNESMVLDDSYSSNVEGFIAAINAAGQINSTHKLIISRGLIELGEEKKTSYQKIVDEINKSNLTLLTTDALFKKLDTRNKVVAFQNEGKLLNYVKEKSDKNTLIVIEGRFEPKILKSLISNF